MLLTLLDKNNSFDYVLPKKVSGKYIIDTINDNGKVIPLIAVEENDGRWFLKSNKSAFLKDSKNNLVLKIELDMGENNQFIDNQIISVYFEPETMDTKFKEGDEVAVYGEYKGDINKNHIIFGTFIEVTN